MASTDKNNAANPYGCSVKELRELMEYRGKEAMEKLHNDYGAKPTEEICKRLKTGSEAGLPSSTTELERRQKVYGKNYIPPKPPKSFFMLMFEAVQDMTLLILIGAAVVSLALSFYNPEAEERKLNSFFFSASYICSIQKKHFHHPQ